MRKFFVIILLVAMIPFGVSLLKSVLIKDEVIEPRVDTEYNKYNKDSLNKEIVNKDSVIDKLNKRIQYDTETIKALDDSNTIKLFYELVEG